MTVYFRDGYRHLPMAPRAALVLEIARLKCLLWSDASDAELRARIAVLEAELAAFDRTGKGSAA